MLARYEERKVVLLYVMMTVTRVLFGETLCEFIKPFNLFFTSY